ncbi:hypothetical protein LJR034_004052 [Caballeronia sp. LjRoot34]|uniref:hypothetical protein n=1 Tax=Caballeronia sp. LjRoot34 TaxID=3342325 RepID=UPI003ECD6991
MSKRLIFFSLLMLPGAFIVLTIVCLHPRYRMKVVQLVGMRGLLSRFEWTRLRFFGIGYAHPRDFQRSSALANVEAISEK